MLAKKNVKGRHNVTQGDSRNRYFSISIKLLPTKETFSVTKISNEMKIKELKALAEFATGIPYHMQILRYLDEGDLLDSSDVRSNDIVLGAQLNLNVWNMWSSLVEAAGTGDIDQVFRLGVTQNTDFSTPNSEYMSSSAKSAWIADRAFTALFIAAHRGYQKLVDNLIDAGADVNGKTSLGRSPLHVAASHGHGNVVDQLLNRGADIDAVDQFGDTALAVASKFNHKGCERQIFLFSWQQRAKNLKPAKEHELFAHQYFDSAFPVWLKGEPQIYHSNVLPPQEFEGTRINSPKRRPRSSSEPSAGKRCTTNIHEDASSAAGDSDLSYEMLQKFKDSEKAGGMPVIQEETSPTGSKSRQQSGAKAKSSTSSPDARSRHTRSAGKSPDAKSSRSYGFSRTEKVQEVKSKSYDEWLSKKKAKEQKTLLKKKEKMEAKKIVEDDKRRQEEYNEKSYEQWLTEKHPSKKKSSQSKQQKQQTQQKNQTGSNANLVAGGAKTGEDVLRNIMRRRAEEQSDKPSITFDDWLMQKDLDILEQIRAGKTPLQMMLHQGKV